MRRTSTLAVTLAALADTTATLPGLTCGELARVRAFVAGLRRERTGNGPAASDAVTDAAPCLEVLATVLDYRQHIDALLGIADRVTSLGADEVMTVPAEGRDSLRRVVDESAALLDLLIGVDEHHVRALALLFRAARDGIPPS